MTLSVAATIELNGVLVSTRIVLDDEALAAIAAATNRTEHENPHSPYMTVAEAAALLRCKRQRIYDLLSSGRLTRVKEGRRTLIRRAELFAYIDGTSTW